MSKVKVLFTIPNFSTAGSGREMFNIIEGLDKNTFEPYIAVNTAGGALFDEITGKGYNILVHKHSLESEKGIFNKIRKAKQLSGYFKSFGFHIWQSFSWSSDYTEALVAKFSGARYVFVKKNMNWNRKAWKVKGILADAIVARNTTMVNKMFSHFLYRKKVHFIPGAVDVQKFSKARADYRNTLNIPKQVTLICCVAQVVRVKDQATLIRAVAALENTCLILAGRFVDEAYTQELKSLVMSLQVQGRVIMPGSVAAVNDLLHASDIFVLPTSKKGGHEEGCPVALLEAMAASVPCIASNVAGSNDLVQHEKTGLLFTPGSVNELVQCINRYVSDKTFAKAMAANALKKVSEEHRLDRESERFEDLYTKLAAK